MAKLTDKERVGQWDKRITAASKVYEDWAAEYSCDMLEEYYYGKQWQGESAEWDKRKYVINLFYPSINISKPSLLFQLPKYRVTPLMTRMDDQYSDVAARAKLQEDTLNTQVQSPQLGFATETGLAILDAQFRCGIVQVGYTADFIDNPNAGRPIMKDGDVDQFDAATGQTVKVKGKVPMVDGDDRQVMEANVKIKSEGLFLKWIPAKHWRISEHAGNRLATADWCGYFEWHTAADLRSNPRYKNTASLKAIGKLKGSHDEAQSGSEEQSQSGMVKTWFVWDLRSKMRYVFAQGGEKFLLEEPFKFLPFASLKFDERLGKWLPLPPSYNWIHPQNELNDTREMQRVHRKRAVRRYLRKPGIEPEEFAKLTSDEDMVSIEVPDPENSIRPMMDAPLDAAVARNIPQSHDDFTRISGISGESQQVAQSETATQANLIALAGQTREAAKRLVVAMFLSEIGRIILLTLRENMALPFWIKIAVDPDSPLAEIEAEEVTKLWSQIDNEALGDIDNDVSVDITSLSPIAQEQERANWLTFLQLVTNPQLGAILSGSPTLLRKTAGMFDIHNERDIREVSAAMEKAAIMFAQAQAAKAGVAMPPGPGPTPTNSDIASQLTKQLPVEMAQ